MSIQSVNAEILAGNFTDQQLLSVIDAVKFARARLAEKNKRALTLGTKVQFTSTRTGQLMQGTVQKIAIKNVKVLTAKGLWQVPASMLTVVALQESA